jgi:hypothetical protein
LRRSKPVCQQSADWRGDALRREGRKSDQSGLNGGTGVSGDEAADNDQLNPGADVADDRCTPQKPDRPMAERQEWVVRHNKTPG